MPIRAQGLVEVIVQRLVGKVGYGANAIEGQAECKGAGGYSGGLHFDGAGAAGAQAELLFGGSGDVADGADGTGGKRGTGADGQGGIVRIPGADAGGDDDGGHG